MQRIMRVGGGCCIKPPANPCVSRENSCKTTVVLFVILSATQPIDFVIANGNGLTTLDNIVTVSSALINICDSVIPFE